ncbi:dipeptidyl peptidase 9 isoform X2 [Agrilus planipennis]|uniref:Dipeptidyl peptidase 9 isoform X2 n=1 Tax=Agrilus planipennis TaxID=224129 RepID=A0A1W4WHH4_AGRPL|nr:dipeptidyl peptidase 9 isoform X2 [Agrilus planipennis]
MDVKEKDGKLSWSELKGVVNDLRRQLSSLSSMIPTSVSFRTLADGRTRIYYLSTPQNAWETTLLYSDIPSSCQSTSMREEQLLWERKRLTTWGITSYEIHPESGKIIFSTTGTLFQCIDNGYSNGQLFPTKLRMMSAGAKLNPQICPSNPDLVAYICNYDIWVAHTVSACNVRLTYAHKGGRNLADDPLCAGVPSYVMQEEFNRYQGYWWQPTCKDGIYRILYEEVDEGDVKIFCFPSSQGDSGEIEEFRFPRAGSANSKSYLKMIEFKLNDNKQIVDICMLELQFSLSMLFPWMEYLVRVGWVPDTEYIWVQLLNRRQQRLDLVLLSLNNFTEVLPMYDSDASSIHLGSPIVQVILSQESPIWINVHDLLYFLPSVDNNEIQFIWASEDTGFRHLYLITSQIMLYTNGIMETMEPMDFVFLQPKISQKVALTSGDWEVLGQNLWVNNDRQLVYFMGLKETPLEKHLYVVSLRRPGEVRLLTRPGYSYNIDFNEECTIVVAVYSNIEKLPACQVFRVVHTDWTVDGLSLTPIGYILESGPCVNPSFLPKLYTHEVSGQVLYAMVFKPHNFEPHQKYPTVLNVYGGPEVQLVSNTFKGMRQLRMHMLAARGYCVIAIDSRGSQHRGLIFESHLKGRMGTVELQDQVEVLKWLIDSLGYIDTNRVAIHGWSYGGYLSLMGLVHYPEMFKVAVAGAPVTNWNLYDTGYTERYMDLPEHNPQGYIEGSVLNHVNKFPDEENRLLIIHGLMDENVHFYHTSQLINCLIKAGKPYQLQIYPNERHSLRHLDASKHYETTLLSFLQNNL